ncbi:MAG: DUF1080 domain-containing protein [Burkholderiales bacterium]|nr:DUF1080 domain-containing protein [Opitutaceae bacterium]
MNLKSLLAPTLAALALPLLGFAQTPVPLFNGKDLSGWVQRGGKATYTVEGDAIVGHSVAGTPNTFLCTERAYGDFVLELDFKVDPALNSGVQFRSECFEQPTEITTGGKTSKLGAGRVHGYQFEIDVDPKRNLWRSGGVYDEARRGWLFPGPAGGDNAAFTDQGRALSKPDDWNHVRIEAVGDSIKTYLNGTLRADFKDAATLSGLIALQVHGIGKDKEKEGATVRWRNLMITELTPAANTLTTAEKAAGWRLLWDGRTSDGWRSAKADTFPSAGWTLGDGVLSVAATGGGEARAAGDIITRERFTDFELLVDFKITPGANSGIKYYVQPGIAAISSTGVPTAVGSAIGLEFQVLDDARNGDAKLGRDGNRTVGSLYDLITAAPDKKVNPVGEWNTARIIAKGPHVEHWLNGVKVLDYERGSEAFRQIVARSKYSKIKGFGEWADGHLLLQDHGNAVSFRNIKIRIPSAQ